MACGKEIIFLSSVHKMRPVQNTRIPSRFSINHHPVGSHPSYTYGNTGINDLCPLLSGIELEIGTKGVGAKS
jgi:hypothetical protein